jgi:2-haloacid dehalogenase
MRAGHIGFRKLDVLHRRNLDLVLPRFGIGSLGERQRRELNRAWHRLDAWPDVASGLARLKNRHWLAPVSNGNISLMIDLARRNDFPWDAILGAEFARDYKPNPSVYLTAVDAFGLEVYECMMVAAHSSDLAAAAELGLRTAHIARLDEKGKGRGEVAPTVPVDIAASDLGDLAAKLSA